MIPLSSAAWRLRSALMSRLRAPAVVDLRRGRQIAAFNPLRRVRRWCVRAGEALIESTAILDYLDELVGPEKAMIPARGPERRHVLKLCALATGLGDRRWVSSTSACFGGSSIEDLGFALARRRSAACWKVLEKERAAIASPYWFGARIGHADIAIACVLRFTREAHPHCSCTRYPAFRHTPRVARLPVFAEIAHR